jgi:hypothetical protein
MNLHVTGLDLQKVVYTPLVYFVFEVGEDRISQRCRYLPDDKESLILVFGVIADFSQKKLNHGLAFTRTASAPKDIEGVGIDYSGQVLVLPECRV